MRRPVLAQYERLVELGDLEGDAAQLHAAERLDRLAGEILSYRPGRPKLLWGFLKGRTLTPRGVYLFGAVGRGKTMLMDLFFDVVDFAPKRRLHFHEFMAEAHERIQRGRATTDGDPIPFVAGEIAAETALLCLDELTITNIADAMIVGRLFKGLFEHGLVMVATSNTAPGDLYRDGLNRHLFLPFIALLEANLDAIELLSKRDFRHDKLAGRQLYFSPCDTRAKAAIEDHWQRLTGHHPAGPLTLHVLGRTVEVPRAAMGVARFTFDDLCERPLGTNDYLHIARTFHTVILEGIPVLSPERRNAAQRFIHLIDTLYDNQVCLIASAEAEPGLLFSLEDRAAPFARAASRLMEMRSEAYLEQRMRGVRAPSAESKS